MAATFGAQVDKEMTVFTGSVHRDNGIAYLDAALPQLLTPGFREEDFRRLKDAQKNALAQDLIANNEEELGKERLQAVVFAGTPYGHPALGTLAGIDAITLDDVKALLEGRLHPCGAHRRPRGRRPHRPEDALPVAARRASRGSGPPGPGRGEGAHAAGPRGRDRPEGDPRHGDLLRDRRSRSPARIRTSPPSRWPAPGSASTARRCRTSTSGSASCAA